MNLFLNNLKDKLMGIVQAASRYPLTILFLLAAAIINILLIHGLEEAYTSLLWTVIIGAMLGLVSQQVYERFFSHLKQRGMLYTGAIVLTIGYYFTINSIETWSMQMEINTSISIFALLMVFIWVPSIKNKILFNETFMATFKAFFTTVLFTAVIAIGLNLSIFAVDQLLFSVDSKVYAHVLNLVFTLFAPLFFLSRIPFYPGKSDHLTGEKKARMDEAIACPKVLAILLSYVIVPLTMLYTLILFVYVLLNIRGDFWGDNLLEPMLVSYSITVILVLILVSGLQDSIAVLGKKILPKILLPIVLFQLIASLLKIGELGITHGRYYVILFGIFALIASVIFSFFPIQKSGWIAAVLIVFSAVSIIPPIDAFTVSRVNQTKLLQKVLVENEMFQDGKVIPNAEIATEDKRKITETALYLERMQYTKKIDWLPDHFYDGNAFQQTFGFQEMYDGANHEYRGQSVYLDWNSHSIIDIEGYDRMLRLDVNENERKESVPLTIQDHSYQLREAFEGDDWYLLLEDDQEELMRFHLKDALNEIIEHDGVLNIEDATVTQENELVRMTAVANFIDRYDENYSGEIYLFIEMK